MPALQRLLIVLGLFLCIVVPDALSLAYPASNEIASNKHEKIQYAMDSLSNKTGSFLGSKAVLIAQKEGSPRSNKRDMTPEQRERLKERRKRFESLSPEEKKRVKEVREKFKQLPPGEREKLRKKWRNLSLKERDKALKKKHK